MKNTMTIVSMIFLLFLLSVNLCRSSQEKKEENCCDDIGNNKEKYELKSKTNKRIAEIYVFLMNIKLDNFDAEFKKRIEDAENDISLTEETETKKNILINVLNYLGRRISSLEIVNQITKSGKVDEIYRRFQLAGVKKNSPVFSKLKGVLWDKIVAYIGKPTDVWLYEKNDIMNLIFSRTNARLRLHTEIPEEQKNKVAEFAIHSFLFGEHEVFKGIANCLNILQDKEIKSLLHLGLPSILFLSQKFNQHLRLFFVDANNWPAWVEKMLNYHLDQIMKSQLSPHKLQKNFKIHVFTNTNECEIDYE